MPNTVEFSIASLNFQVDDELASPPEWLLRNSSVFKASSSDNPSVRIRICRDSNFSAGQEMFSFKPVGKEGGFELLGYDFLAKRQRAGLPFEVVAHPNAGIAGLLRSIASISLIERDSLLLHSAAFEIDGFGGVLCAGPSGSGKTTISRLLLPAFRVFTDETTVLKMEKGTPVIYSTPFAGELGPVCGAALAKLEAVFLLKHAGTTYVRELGPSESLSRLMSCVFLPVREEPFLSKALEIIDNLAKCVFIAELGFVPEPKIREDIREFIMQAEALS